MNDSVDISPVCTRFHRAIELIGSRWTGAILQTLLRGRTRYASIKVGVPDITDRMLSERLRSLEAEGLVLRAVVPDTPVRVEYELTKKGRELQDALGEIGKWAEKWISLDDEVTSNNNHQPRIIDRRQRQVKHA